MPAGNSLDRPCGCAGAPLRRSRACATSIAPDTIADRRTATWDRYPSLSSSLSIRVSLLVVSLLALALLFTLPRGFDSARWLAAEDDPVRLSDLALEKRFDSQIAAREIEAALAAGDVELAESFLALARERGVAVDRFARRPYRGRHDGVGHDGPRRRAIRARVRGRRAGRSHEPCRNRGRRSVRVRRCARRGAGRGAARARRRGRRADPRPRLRRACGHRWNLCEPRRRRTGARRA